MKHAPKSLITRNRAVFHCLLVALFALSPFSEAIAQKAADGGSKKPDKYNTYVIYQEISGNPDEVWKISPYGRLKVNRAEIPAGAVIKPAPPPPPRFAVTPSLLQLKPENGTQRNHSAPATSAPPRSQPSTQKSPAKMPSPAPTASLFQGSVWTYATSSGRQGVFEFRADGSARYFDGTDEFPGTWMEVCRNVAYYRMTSNPSFTLFFLLSDDTTALLPFRPANTGAWQRKETTFPAPAIREPAPSAPNSQAPAARKNPPQR